MEKDTYKTILKPSKEVLIKEKGSKFFGYAFPVIIEEDVKNYLELLKKQHHTARHFCYAYQIGVEQIQFRTNDDGEPNNSAGMPIYGQMQSFDVTNILVVVVRYFGGTKLGVGGLISAYKNTAKKVLEISDLIEKTIDVYFQLNFGYDVINNVQRIIKEKNLNIVSQELELSCQYTIEVRKNDAETVFKLFKNLHRVNIKQIS